MKKISYDERLKLIEMALEHAWKHARQIRKELALEEPKPKKTEFEEEQEEMQSLLGGNTL